MFFLARFTCFLPSKSPRFFPLPLLTRDLSLALLLALLWIAWPDANKYPGLPSAQILHSVYGVLHCLPRRDAGDATDTPEMRQKGG
jgi:hypothetical protein